MANWVKALKELSKQQPTDKDMDQIIHEMLHMDSDRGAALIDAAQIETILGIIVREALVPLTVEENESLFERDGVLSSFSKLIRVAQAFGLIDKVMTRNLHIVREVRNVFAHAQTPINFECPAIANACSLLTPGSRNLRGRNTRKSILDRSTSPQLHG